MAARGLTTRSLGPQPQRLANGLSRSRAFPVRRAEVDSNAAIDDRAPGPVADGTRLTGLFSRSHKVQYRCSVPRAQAAPIVQGRRKCSALVGYSSTSRAGDLRESLLHFYALSGT